MTLAGPAIALGAFGARGHDGGKAVLRDGDLVADCHDRIIVLAASRTPPPAVQTVCRCGLKCRALRGCAGRATDRKPGWRRRPRRPFLYQSEIQSVELILINSYIDTDYCSLRAGTANGRHGRVWSLFAPGVISQLRVLPPGSKPMWPHRGRRDTRFQVLRAKDSWNLSRSGVVGLS